MKIAIAIISAMSMTAAAYAQEAMPEPVAQKQKDRNNEIGIMSEVQFNNDDRSTYFAGLQYKHWVKPYMGIRAIVSYAQYEDFGKSFYTGRVGDTVFETSARTTIPMVYVGGGIEMQRKFYKKVYLFAAVEVRGGYGSGWYNMSSIKTVQNDAVNYRSETGNGPSYKGVSMLSIEASPRIGAKLQFKKLCIGTELSLINMNLRSTTGYPYKADGTSYDLYVGNLSERFFIHYRF